MPRWYENETDLKDIVELDCTYAFEFSPQHDILVGFIAIGFDYPKMLEYPATCRLISLN